MMKNLDLLFPLYDSWLLKQQPLIKGVIENSQIDTVDNNKPGVVIPRFKLKKQLVELAGWKLDETTNFNLNLMRSAIRYGMIIKITYRGEKDKSLTGHERFIYPMVIGKKNNKTYLRAWHFKGYSQSLGPETQKVWRLFRTDRILNMNFQGQFFRLAPKGYEPQDSFFDPKGQIIERANFNRIRNNQEDLLTQEKVIDINQLLVTNQPNKVVQTTNSDKPVNLNDFWSNPNFKQYKNTPEAVHLIFGRRLDPPDYELLVIHGALGEVGKTIDVEIDGQKWGLMEIDISGDAKNIHLLKSYRGHKILNLVTFKNQK